MQLAGAIANAIVIGEVLPQYVSADLLEIVNTVQTGIAAYTTAMKVYEVREMYVEANEEYNKLVKEVEEKRKLLDARMNEMYSRKVRRSYAEADEIITGPALASQMKIAKCQSDLTNGYNPEAHIPYNFSKKSSCTNEATDFGYEVYLEPVSYKDY